MRFLHVAIVYLCFVRLFAPVVLNSRFILKTTYTEETSDFHGQTVAYCCLIDCDTV